MLILSKLLALFFKINLNYKIFQIFSNQLKIYFS